MGFGKNGEGSIIREQHSASLGALGGDTAIVIGNLVFQEDFRCLKRRFSCHVGNLTAGEGGGLLLGVANGELSPTEIKEAIEIDGPLDRNDRDGVEKSERMVHIVGVSRPLGPDAVFLQFEGPDGGILMIDKFRWTYNNPEGWDWFIYNAGVVLTSGAVAKLVLQNFGVWIT